MNLELTLIFGGVAAFGFLWVAVGVGILSHQSRFRRRALTAQGVIVGLRKVVTGGHGHGHMGMVFRPTVRFMTADGRDIQAESRTGTNPSPGRVGKLVTVYYDPADPWRFTLESIARLSGCIASAFIVAGGAIMLIATVIFVEVTL